MFLKALSRQPTFFWYISIPKSLALFLKAFKGKIYWSACYLRSFRIRGTYYWKCSAAAVFFFNVPLFECVRALKIKSQQCSMTGKQVNDQTTEGAPPMLKSLWKQHLLYDVFLHFYTQFLSGWWTVLRELTKKSVFYSFGNHPLTDSTNSVKQW